MPQAPLTTDGLFWNGMGAFNWGNEVMVGPEGFTTEPNTWPLGYTSDIYFGLGTAGIWDQIGKDLSTLPGFTDGTLISPTVAIGDPCRYYLGGSWRLPTVQEWSSLLKNKYPCGTIGGSWPAVNLNWGHHSANDQGIGAIGTANYTTDVNSAAIRGIYVNTNAANEAAAKIDVNAIFLPATGSRHPVDGSFLTLGRYGCYRSGSIGSGTESLCLSFSVGGIHPQALSGRSLGHSVRCVSE